MLASEFRVLLIDHEHEHIDDTQEYLLRHGYSVNIASCPVEALNMIKKEHFHMVIYDINTPGPSDFNLIKEIKSHNGFIETVIVTRSISVSQILTAYRHGLSNCFFKPLGNFEELESEVARTEEKLQRAREVLTQRSRLLT